MINYNIKIKKKVNKITFELSSQGLIWLFDLYFAFIVRKNMSIFMCFIIENIDRSFRSRAILIDRQIDRPSFVDNI